MDDERNGTPAGVGPRLPDQKPQQDKKKKPPFTRETLIAGAASVLLLAVGVWFILFAVTAGQTPAMALGRHASEEYALQEEITMVKLPGQGERYAYFYISNDSLACAVLQRRAAGFQVMDVTGHLPLTSADKPGIWMVSGLKGGDKALFVFGLLYDENLSQVEVEGQPAVLVDNGQYRCWYYYGDASVSINSESVVYK